MEKENEIQVFQNPEFGKLRTVVKDGEPWFVAADVCKALEIRTDTVRPILDDDEVADVNPNSIGVGGHGGHAPLIVSEAGLYALILKSRKPSAHAFKRWVTHDVIPSIRKRGAYMTPDTIEKVLCNPDTIIRLATELKSEKQKRISAEVSNAQQKQIIEEMQPKASYYDKVLASPDPVLISVIAKDYGKSGTWLNKKLHEFGVQFKLGGTWLLYQKYAEQGYTKSYTHTYTDSLGTSHSTILTCWTQKGRLFLYDFLREHGILPLMEQEDKRSA